MKEPSAPEIGFVPIDSWSEESFAVPIQQFNFDAIDSPEDFIKEQIAAKKPIGPVLQAWANSIAEHKQAETVRAIMTLIVAAKKPRQRVDEIAFACGMLLAEGETIISMAKKHGISKQAFQRGVVTVCESLGLRKTRTMRGEEAKETMANTNYRRGHHCTMSQIIKQEYGKPDND